MQPTIDLARLFQFGNTPAAGGAMVPPGGGGLPPAPPSNAPFMSPYGGGGGKALVPRGTGGLPAPSGNTLPTAFQAPRGERVIYGSRVGPEALPPAAGGAASRMAPANGLPLMTRAAGAAGLALYSPAVGEGSDRPPATPAPGFTATGATPVPGAKNLPPVGPGGSTGGGLLQGFADRRAAIANDPNTPFKQFQAWLGETMARNVDLGRQALGLPMQHFQPIDAGPGGAPAGNASIAHLVNKPQGPAFSPTNAGPTTIDMPGAAGQPLAAGQPPSTNYIEWSGRPDTRQTYTPEQIASLANRNVVPGLPAPASQGPGQQFDLGALMEMALNKGPGSANETFAQRGERKANKALATQLLNQIMGEQGQNWRAMLGETGQNTRTDKTLAEHLLATLYSQKPTDMQFKTYQTKTKDALGNEVSQDVPLLFNPANGQATLLQGFQGAQGAPGGAQHPFGTYEERKADWDAQAKEWGYKTGKEAYDYSISQYLNRGA